MPTRHDDLTPQSVDTVNDPEPSHGNGIAEGDYGGGPDNNRRIAGDWTDDDSQYLTGLLESLAVLPRLVKGLEPIVDTVPHGNRMGSKRWVLASNGTVFPPQQVLPENPNRVGLIISASINIRIAESIPLTNGAAVITQSATLGPVTFPNFTGAVVVVQDAVAFTAETYCDVIEIVNYDDRPTIGE